MEDIMACQEECHCVIRLPANFGIGKLLFRFYLQLILTIQCLSLCLAGFNLDRRFITSFAEFNS